MKTRDLVATITMDTVPDGEKLEQLKTTYEDEGYRDVRLMRVVTMPGNSVVFDVSAAFDSNPYRVP